MKKAMSILMVTMFSFVCVSSVTAGRIKNRQINQTKRIHQGLHSGELTGREIKRLGKEQRSVQQTKQRAWSDGTLTPKERVRLEHQQNKASQHIYRFKHNNIERQGFGA